MRRGAPYMPRTHRAVSGVISLIMISLVMVLFFAGIIYYTNALYTAQQLQDERAQKISESIALSRNVRATWSHDPLTGTLTLNITNQHTEPVRVTGAVVVYNDGSYEIWSLGHTLSPGEKHSHSKTTGGRTPVSVRVTASTSQGATAGIQAANDTTGTTTPTPGPTWTPITLQGSPLIHSPATTWHGNARYYDPTTTLPGTPQNPITYNQGTPVSGDATSLQADDSLLLLVDSITLTVPAQLFLETNNTVIWDDFDTNVITQGKIIPNDPAAWQENPAQSSIRKQRITSTTLPSNKARDIAFINFPSYGYSFSLPNELYAMTKIYGITLPYNAFTGYLVPTSCSTTGKSQESYYFGIALATSNNIGSGYYASGLCTYKVGNQVRERVVISREVTLLASSANSAPFGLQPVITSFINLSQTPYLQTANYTKILSSNIIYQLTAQAFDSVYTPQWVGLLSSGFYQYGLFLTSYRYPQASFDFIYITKEMYPQFLYLKTQSGSYNVEVVRSGLGTVTVAPTTAYDPVFGGYVIDLYAGPNTGQNFKPFFPGQIIVKDLANNVLATYTGEIMGGSVYRFVPGGPQGRISFTFDVVVDLGAFGSVGALELVYDLWANVSGVDVTVEVYDRSVSSFTVVTSGSPPLSGSSLLPGSPSDYIGPLNNVTVRLNATGSSPFRIFVDLLNIASRAPLVEGEVLIIGQGSNLHLYSVDSAVTPPQVTYLTTIPAPPSIDSLGSRADLTVVYPLGVLTTPSRVFVSQPGRGTFWADLGSSQWNPVTGTADGSIVETIDDGGSPGRQDYVLVINDTGASWSYYIISYHGTVVPLITTPPPVLDWEVFDNKTASAYTDWGLHTYVLAFNTSKSRPVITEFKFSGLSQAVYVKEVGELGFMNVVGMSPGPPGKIYIMQEGGTLHEMDVATGIVSSVPVALPFTPLGPGDRLELVGGRPFFLRAESSDQAWVLI